MRTSLNTEQFWSDQSMLWNDRGINYALETSSVSWDCVSTGLDRIKAKKERPSQRNVISKVDSLMAAIMPPAKKTWLQVRMIKKGALKECISHSRDGEVGERGLGLLPLEIFPPLVCSNLSSWKHFSLFFLLPFGRRRKLDLPISVPTIKYCMPYKDHHFFFVYVFWTCSD